MIYKLEKTQYNVFTFLIENVLPSKLIFMCFCFVANKAVFDNGSQEVTTITINQILKSWNPK